jgi:hypothetical protein
MQLLLGFIVTARRLAWYGALPDDWFLDSAFVSKRRVLQQARLLDCPFQSLLGVDGIMADIGWHNCLRFGGYAAGESTTSFWEPQCPQVIPGANGLPPVPYLPVAAIALIVAKLPCREAGVERTFARHWFVLSDHRRSIRDDVIEVLLVVRLHGISNVPVSSQVLVSIGCDVSLPGDCDRRTMSAAAVLRPRRVVVPRYRVPNPNEDQPGGWKAPWS